MLNRPLHLEYGHRLLYDFETMERYAKDAGYSAVKLIPNYEVPDEWIRELLRVRKGCRWNLETETYLLIKGSAQRASCDVSG